MLTALFMFIAALTLPPKPDRYVTDHAGVLPAATASALNEKLAQFERTTSDQILVYIDNRLPTNTTIEEMGAAAIKQWGVGQKGRDNGAILFVFVADRKMRIEVGYGFEGALTDAKSKHITSEILKPAFRNNDYAGGIVRAVDAMMQTVRPEPYAGTGQTVAETAAGGNTSIGNTFVLALFLGSLVQLISGLLYGLARDWRKTRAGMIFSALPLTSVVVAYRTAEKDPGITAFVMLMMLAIPWVITFVIGYFIRASANVRFTAGTFLAGDSPSQTGSSSSWSSSSTSSSSSSSSESRESSFSGGGGSGGGGGASDSW
jgi:uncharacterized membrane protein YgcG